jgi:hypothetical protein
MPPRCSAGIADSGQLPAASNQLPVARKTKGRRIAPAQLVTGIWQLAALSYFGV